MVANILTTPFVSNEHLVPASCAPDDAVQQQLAIAGSPSRFGSHIFGSIIADDASDLLVGLPIYICRIAILDDNTPFFDRS